MLPTILNGYALILKTEYARGRCEKIEALFATSSTSSFSVTPKWLVIQQIKISNLTACSAFSWRWISNAMRRLQFSKMSEYLRVTHAIHICTQLTFRRNRKCHELSSHGDPNFRSLIRINSAQSGHSHLFQNGIFRTREGKKQSSVLKTDGNWHSGMTMLEFKRTQNPVGF
ncbi:hypothetical protein AVEN_171901-1 [Araneus ventricosus]|uniref:Uncharacterized protein n=1 Tax=Araneus ventricosus TaxID=182803 RepID=A0A4Y2BYL0_ARAVE|nr:hypothetical protein AVEN_171901-1 [Araneus ventricosus]